MNIHFFQKSLQPSKYLILTGLCILNISTGLHAQSLEKKHLPNITFKLYTWHGQSQLENELTHPKPLYFQQQGEKTTIHLIDHHEPGVSLSPEYTFPIGSTLTFLKKSTTPTGAHSFDPIASTPLIQQGNTIFQPLTFTDKKYAMLAVNTSPKAFPKNTLLFINHSDQALRVHINKVEMEITAKGVEPIPFLLSKKNTLRIIVTPADNPTKKLSITTIGGAPNQRIIGFFYQINAGPARLILERGVDDQSAKFKPRE